MTSGLVAAAYLVPWGFGLALYISLRPKPERIEAIVVSWGVGWGCINALTILSNQFAKIAANEEFFDVASVLLAVPALILLLHHRRRMVPLIRGPVVPADLRRGLGLAVVSVFSAFLIFVFYKAAIMPPASTDAIVYHMRIPVVAWQTGYLAMTPGVGWLELANTFPNLLETQQLWIYLGADEANDLFVRPIMPIYTSLLLMIVFTDTRRWFGLASAALATGALFTLNEFASLTTALWAEVPVAFYSYLAVRTIVVGEGIASRAAGGAFAGVATLVKYNGLVVLLALALASALLGLTRNTAKGEAAWTTRVLASLTAFGVIVVTGLLAASPLLFRNWYFFGNPIYPFIWGGVNTEQLGYYLADYSASDYVRFRLHETIVLLGSVVSFAFALGFLRYRYWSQPEIVFALMSLLYLPVFLYPPLAGSHIRYLAPIVPGVAIHGGRQLSWWLRETSFRPRVAGAGLLVGLGTAAALLLALADAKPAYLIQYVEAFVATAAIILVLAMGIRAAHANQAEKITTAILAVVLLAPGIFAVAADRSPPREAASDLRLLPPDRESFLASQFGDDWRMWRWMNANLTPNTVVLTFETRLLYLEVQIIHGAAPSMISAYNMSLGQALLYIQSLGVQYILDSPWSHIPEVNRIFWARSVIFQNLGNTSAFQPFHAEGSTMLYTFVP